MSEKANFRALLPMIVFLVLFIGTGIALTAAGADMPFYQLSATVAIIPAIVLAILQGKDDLNKKIGVFLSGVGEINIITMCMIFLLAGGFASVASAIGGVKATVNFGLSLLPPSMILPGLFLIGAFISTAMGTSMGTVAAIAPIAVGVGEQTDIPLALLLGVVMSGAMFGDNLSMISDTTIAATRTQGCEMKDKFRMNLLIALPAALVTLALLWFAGASGQVVKHEEYQFIRVVPYLAILVMALAGVNVFIVLLAGIVFTGAVGIASVGGYTLIQWSKDIYSGFVGMNEIMVLSMLVGGLGELMRYHGGISWLLERVNGLARKLSAESPVTGGAAPAYLTYSHASCRGSSPMGRSCCWPVPLRSFRLCPLQGTTGIACCSRWPPYSLSCSAFRESVRCVPSPSTERIRKKACPLPFFWGECGMPRVWGIRAGRVRNSLKEPCFSAE